MVATAMMAVAARRRRRPWRWSRGVRRGAAGDGGGGGGVAADGGNGDVDGGDDGDGDGPNEHDAGEQVGIHVRPAAHVKQLQCNTALQKCGSCLQRRRAANECAPRRCRRRPRQLQLNPHMLGQRACRLSEKMVMSKKSREPTSCKPRHNVDARIGRAAAVGYDEENYFSSAELLVGAAPAATAPPWRG